MPLSSEVEHSWSLAEPAGEAEVQVMELVRMGALAEPEEEIAGSLEALEVEVEEEEEPRQPVAQVEA